VNESKSKWKFTVENADGMIQRPIIIIGAPRSGTTILQRCLAVHPGLWHLRAESHYILEGPYHPRKLGRQSNRCTKEDTDEETVESIRERFYEEAMNVSKVLSNPGWLFGTSSLVGRALSAAAVLSLGNCSKLAKPDELRFLEKTPKNSLRVSLLDRLFPDALFIWNRRHPANNIDSLVAGWHTSDKIGPIELPRFARASYPVAEELNLKDYSDKWWKFALVPEWETLQSKTIGEVAAWQYYQCNRYALKDFQAIDDERIFELDHESFVRDPLSNVRDILEWADLPTSQVIEQFSRALPQVNDTRGETRDEETGLRYPEGVQRGMRSVAELNALSGRMGYDEIRVYP
jgi:hypothetical protein